MVALAQRSRGVTSMLTRCVSAHGLYIKWSRILKTDITGSESMWLNPICHERLRLDRDKDLTPRAFIQWGITLRDLSQCCQYSRGETPHPTSRGPTRGLWPHAIWLRGCDTLGSDPSAAYPLGFDPVSLDRVKSGPTASDEGVWDARLPSQSGRAVLSSCSSR